MRKRHPHVSASHIRKRLTADESPPGGAAVALHVQVHTVVPTWAEKEELRNRANEEKETPTPKIPCGNLPRLAKGKLLRGRQLPGVVAVAKRGPHAAIRNHPEAKQSGTQEGKPRPSTRIALPQVVFAADVVGAGKVGPKLRQVPL